jgi:serine/threonine protein kinase
VQIVGGRYELATQLGEGGMGCVYRAKHLQLGKVFALKLINSTFALHPEARARFNQEAKLASEITHPNIVSIVDYGEDDQLGAYMVMELVEGEPLISDTAPMSIKRACDLLVQIAEAIDHIHKTGIVHGDIKADNIMLTTETSGQRRRRMVRLLDFGLARRAAEGSSDGRISGSPQYLAPERCAGGPPTVAGDIYAIGVLGYQMLAGAVPFDGEVIEVLTKQMSEEPAPIVERRGEPIDDALCSLIMRALAKDVAVRHASAAAFRYELNTVMDMLALTQRRRVPKPENLREQTLAAAFDKSRLPQALISRSGELAFANRAFCQLVGADTVDGKHISDTELAVVFPALLRTIVLTHEQGKPQERRARVYRGSSQPALELVLWFSPLNLPGHDVHLTIRYDDEPKRRD